MDKPEVGKKYYIEVELMDLFPRRRGEDWVRLPTGDRLSVAPEYLIEIPEKPEEKIVRRNCPHCHSNLRIDGRDMAITDFVPNADKPVEPKQAQKWEYRAYTAHSIRDMDKLGIEGWEAYAVLGNTHYFKRPL